MHTMPRHAVSLRVAWQRQGKTDECSFERRSCSLLLSSMTSWQVFGTAHRWVSHHQDDSPSTYERQLKMQLAAVQASRTDTDQNGM